MRIQSVTLLLKKSGLSQGLLQSRVGSILHLISGNVGNALIMLAGLSIAARALGNVDFGTMAIVLTIGRVCERLLRFESWQPLVRYAAQEETEGDPIRLSRLYLYGLLLDIGSALLAACLTIGAGFALSGLLGLHDGGTTLVAIYACAVAVNIRGMPSAALRLAGQFKTIAYFQILANSLRLVMAVACYVHGAGLLAFVLIWTVAQMIDSLLFCFLGFRTLRNGGIPSPWRADWRNLYTDFPGFLGFAFATNLSSSMRTLTQEADTLLVGAFAGNAAAGFYHLAKRMAKIAQQVGEMVQTVIYPDLARMWKNAGNKAFGRLVGAVQAILATVALSAVAATWLIGDHLVDLVFGPEFADSYPLLLTQLVAVLLILHAAPTRSALLAMNRPGYVLKVTAASTILFFAVAIYTLPRFGALGANLAHIAFGTLTAVLLDFAFWRGVAKKPDHPVAASVATSLGRDDAGAVDKPQRAGPQMASHPIRPALQLPRDRHICSILTSLTSGGAEMLVANLSGAFVQAGERSTVIALCDAATVGNSPDMEARLKRQIESHGGNFVSLGLDRKRGLLSGGFALRKVLLQLQPDVIHAHTARALGMIALAGVRVPTVLTHHNSKLSFPPRMFALFDRIASGYVAISEETAGIYRSNARRPCRLIPNAAGPKFRSEGPRNGLSRPARVLSVGAVSEQKNYGLLIEVAQQLRNAGCPSETPIFQVAGHGAAIEELRERVTECGLGDTVRFLGERSDIESLMAQSDIYLNTSIYEGMPVALLEAMAMALPIVATDVAGNRELVQNGEGGFLCEFGNPAAIAEGLACLIQDEERYRRMSSASLIQSENYSLAGTAREHIDLYESLIASRRS